MEDDTTPQTIRRRDDDVSGHLRIGSGSLLTYEISSFPALLEVTEELAFHHDVTTAVCCGEDSYVLAVECARTERIVWDVRTTVAMFDPQARLVYHSP